MGSMQSSETHSTLLDERREMFEAALEKHVADAEAGPSGAVMELAKHVLLAGGKRWRPVLVLLAYELAGGENDEDIMPLALAFELIHTATLVHDDINDNAKLRRGVVTLHERFGSVRAVVVGDYLFVEGFALGGMFSQRIVGLIADCCTRIAAAELKQLEHVGDLGTTPEDYYAIIEGKTAGPFAAGCEAAAVVAGADEQTAARLGSFGLELGLAFQIVDDLLDLLGDERMGKPRGADVIEGKMTLPLIHALTLSHGDARRRLGELISDFNDGVWEELIELLERSGSLEYASVLVNNHLTRALDSLLTFPKSDLRDGLEWLTRQVMERNE